MMNEELNKQLLEILKSTTETIGNAKGFILGEVPDVVYQLLSWYGVYSIILGILGVIVLTTSLIYLRKMFKSYSDKTWAYDRGDLSGYGLSTLVVSSTTSAVGVIMIINIMTALKIWIAPKIWLIEYTTTLAKG